nr:hypothetical protein [Tanacetum cinerariifolium]
MSASGILSLPELDGIDDGNGNNEVGSGVYTGNGIRSYLRTKWHEYSIESPSDFSSSPSFSSGSILGSDSMMYPGDSAVGDTAAGSGYSSAESISSAGGRYF